jgi:hypothetical protein
MRNATILTLSASLGFILYCIGAVVARLWVALSQPAATTVFLSASFALLAAFVFAGISVTKHQPASRSRMVSAVLLVVAGFPVSWLLGVHAGRVVAGMLGFTV